MSYRVIIQPNAEAELDAAYLYRYTRAPQSAARWFAGIVEAINSLAEFPERCPLAPENGHFPEEIRQLLYATRRDVFRIVTTKVVKGPPAFGLYCIPGKGRIDSPSKPPGLP